MNCDFVIHGRISVYIRIDACIAFANCRQISVAINFDHIGIAGAPTDVAITRITAIEVRTCPVPLPHGQRIPLRCLADRKISGCRFAILLAAVTTAIQTIITIAGARRRGSRAGMLTCTFLFFAFLIRANTHFEFFPFCLEN